MHRVRAVNTAADSDNKIHSDDVAAAYGFRGGLVPGVTVYGYMTLAVLEHFGERWLDRGRMRVRFKEPVYEGEQVAIDAKVLDDGRLQVCIEGGRASGVAWMEGEARPPLVETFQDCPIPSDLCRPNASRETLRAGTVLGAHRTVLDLRQSRMSAPLPAAIGDARLAHPAILLSLANELLVRNVVLGPWIHTASEVTNYSPVRDGAALTVRGRVAEQYEHKGHEFVVLDILIASDEGVVQYVRHTAIWQPRLTATGAV